MHSSGVVWNVRCEADAGSEAGANCACTMLKHGGIASKGHCVAFPQAVQELATILPRLPSEVDIICVRRQGRYDTHEDFRVRRHVLKKLYVD